MSGPVLRVAALSKRFGATRALTDVDLEVAPGEIHALIGPNGSGKSTLIKILAGYHHAEPGAVAELDGEPFDLSQVAASRHDRLRFVHQELGLVGELSAVDNLALSHGFARTAFGNIRWAEMERRTHALVERFGLGIDVRRPLSTATPVQRTVVAIAAALQGWEGRRGVLVLDEPTAVLPPGEVARLFDIVREVRDAGAGVLYVSHRMDEIFALADRVTVIRGGRRIATRAVADLTPRSLAELMAGEEMETDHRPPPPAASGGPVLEVRDLSAGPLRGVGFDLARGERLGVTGLVGSGHEIVPYAVCGAHTGRVGGRLRLPERSTRWTEARDARALGLPLVPADRAGEGVIGDFSVGENLTLPLLDRLRSRSGRLRRRREAALTEDWISRVDVRTAGRGARITTLSGGNQQKVVMARCLAQRPPVLTLCEPTAGVDIATRLQLYDLIERQADEGMGVIVSSSDTQDLLALCTRVLVVRDGRIAREISGRDITESALVHAMEGTE
ncbi:sugar ABC transporter ATP-binding protein [Streptomyces griseorubiginosus]|uniref:sugar ABC transporter ATP-binding protein n=1 Tax=Streptomyces griseorubiginosus TaxID=67304 RepID=UPI002E80EF9E|nr:sugar ABC transporter ATP-binding protein [Streptomyces griseorubiginosus]WUB49698.1 sugar ABC transporter ATP-binding protein [Streptomyces griseorubiginosus]WUB58227.1 sugar ABC transporter ATP-binding protein [Streptomyces griseorubiginosus]